MNKYYDEYIKKAQENDCGKICDTCDENGECSIIIDALQYAESKQVKALDVFMYGYNNDYNIMLVDHVWYYVKDCVIKGSVNINIVKQDLEILQSIRNVVNKEPNNSIAIMLAFDNIKAILEVNNEK